MRIEKETNHKFKNYIILFIFICMLYAISACIYLNGDDYMYGEFAKSGAFNNVYKYYITGNGRFWINILDSILLFFDRYLYCIINPLIIFSFIVLLAKNVRMMCKKNIDSRLEFKFIQYGIILFSCLDILCLRETVFWITGMMNYLFPGTVFLSGLYLFQKSINNNLSKSGIILYLVVSFFAACSVEQFALMYVGITSLTILQRIIRKQKIYPRDLIAFCISLVALCFLLLAPGNFVRIDAQAQIKPAFIDNLWTLIYQNTYSQVAFPYMVMLSACTSLYLRKNVDFDNKNRMTCLLMMSEITTFLWLFFKSFDIFEKAFIVIPLNVLLAIQLIWLLIVRNYRAKRLIIVLVFVGIGSQLMLLVSSIFGFRCMFSMYLIEMLIILYLLAGLDDKKAWMVLLVGASSAVHPICGLFLFVVGLLYDAKGRPNKRYSYERATTMICALLLLSSALVGYYKNTSTARQNREYALSGEPRVMLKTYNNVYTWEHFPLNIIHEKYFRLYYGLSDQTDIIYISENGQPLTK